MNAWGAASTEMGAEIKADEEFRNMDLDEQDEVLKQAAAESGFFRRPEVN